MNANKLVNKMIGKKDASSFNLNDDITSPKDEKADRHK